jgi:hypothetical protein
MRRHAKRPMILACVAGLSLCLIVSGCSSASPGNASQGAGSTGSPGSPGATSSCDSAAYRFHGRASLTAGQSVLAAIQLPDPVEIPPPDVDVINEAFPEGEDQGQQETWASEEKTFAQSVANNQSQNQVTLQSVSDEVSADEVSSLLVADLNELDSGNGGYDADLCDSIDDLNEQFGHYLEQLDKLNDVVNYLNTLTAPNGTTAPGDLAGAIQDATTKFQQNLGSCVDDLDTIQWIVDQIQAIFCHDAK